MSETLKEIGEKGLLQRLKSYLGKNERVVRVFSEDCAVLDQPGQDYLLATVDAFVEGIHFDRDFMSPYYIGRKALKVNFSDIHSMGGRSLFYLVSLGAPAEFPVQALEEIYQGFESVAKASQAICIGGNVTRSPFLFLDITVLGNVRKDRVMYRHTAREGDVIFVSGRLGAAAEGLLLLKDGFRMLGDALIMPEGNRDSSYVSEMILAQWDPPDTAELAQALGSTGMVHAMIDLSDGLISDLGEICRESNVGARIEREKIPVAGGVSYWERKRKRDPLSLALSGGEDYHLLLTVSRGKAKQFSDWAKNSGFDMFEIGTIVSAEEGFYIEDREGARYKPGAGYEHFR